jgi:peptide/nickel transport system permease protein
MSKGYRRYFGKKIIWFLITLTAAVVLNFFLPRMMPGDPVATILGRLLAGGQGEPEATRRILEHYTQQFGIDKPLWQQFFIYVGNLFKGEFGVSFSRHPTTVAEILRAALPWTLALQLPAIITGWIIGNVLGAIAAYIRKGFDKVIIPVSLFVSGIPAFGMAVILMSVFAVSLGWLPVQGGYPHTLLPSFTLEFFRGLIYHYHLPFWSIVLISIGGQAIGMRSMSIYELNADYVKYSRYMGIKDHKIVGYVFRNAMLPQVTGLALQIGTIIGGALVAERVFSYPGLGSTMFSAISQNDYPLISATTLIITVMVLVVVFLLDILYGLIDPRVKAAMMD